MLRMLLWLYRYRSSPATIIRTASQMTSGAGIKGIMRAFSWMIFSKGFPSTKTGEPPLSEIGSSEKRPDRRNLELTPLTLLISSVLRISSPPMTLQSLLPSMRLTRYHLGPRLM